MDKGYFGKLEEFPEVLSQIVIALKNSVHFGQRIDVVRWKHSSAGVAFHACLEKSTL